MCPHGQKLEKLEIRYPQFYEDTDEDFSLFSPVEMKVINLGSINL